jgi:hypothetical protein
LSRHWQPRRVRRSSRKARPSRCYFASNWRNTNGRIPPCL